MGFSNPERTFKVTGQTVTNAQLHNLAQGYTNAELRTATSADTIYFPLNFAAVDCDLHDVNLLNEDFECAELYPNYGRIEHTRVNELVISSMVICDILDESTVNSILVYGRANVKHKCKVNHILVEYQGYSEIYDCDIDTLEVRGTVIITCSKVNKLEVHPGGRVFHNASVFNDVVIHRTPVLGEQNSGDDPYVLSPFNSKLQHILG